MGGSWGWADGRQRKGGVCVEGHVRNMFYLRYAWPLGFVSVEHVVDELANVFGEDVRHRRELA
jgi:hypothetical protein